jgi:hypothetical protein
MVIVNGQSQLHEMILALRPPRCFSSLLYRRQQESNKNCDDRNHDKQFDERESTRSFRYRHNRYLAEQRNDKNENKEQHNESLTPMVTAPATGAQASPNTAIGKEIRKTRLEFQRA